MYIILEWNSGTDVWLTQDLDSNDESSTAQFETEQEAQDYAHQNCIFYWQVVKITK